MTETQTNVTTRSVGSGDDIIHYDVHGELSAATADRPALLTFANPMEAAAFGALTAQLQDRPVVTIDPRGAGRNPSGMSAMTPYQHAEDLHRVIESLDAGAVDAFGSSGGAISLLALLGAHGGDVRRAVVHEPPFVDVLADRDVALAACSDIRDTYDSAGNGAVMAKFIALVMQPGPLPDDYLDRPAPDPAAFGMTAEDDGDRTNPLMRNMPACNAFVPDYAALAAFGARLCVAVGAESGQQLAARGAHGLAARLGSEAHVFPGGHTGFVSTEDNMPGHPEEFAAELRKVLA